jgi:hypothetical protein
VEKEKRDTIKRERPTSVNWKDEHHQVDVKITIASRGQPLQIKLGQKKKDCLRCTVYAGCSDILYRR